MKLYLPGDPAAFKSYCDAFAALGAQVQGTAREDCDALLLSGGGDVHPCRYGQEVCGSEGIDKARDAREWEALRYFTDARRPVLGICRGMQVINVFFGGTLHQNIRGHSREAGASGEKHDHKHDVRTDDAVLRALYGARFTVNSAHHQSVDRLGDGLRAIAWADDGTVEAVRHETLPVWGVQWHPERLRVPADGWLLLARWLLGL